MLHKPSNMCIQQFREVLDFWKIPTQCVDNCCRKQAGESKDEAELSKLIEEENINATNAAFGSGCLSKSRRFLWDLFENCVPVVLGRVVNTFSILTVLLSVIQIIISSIPEFQTEREEETNTSNTKPEMVPIPPLMAIDLFCNIWFTIEFLLRVFACPDRKDFFKSPMNLIDLLAILPFHLELGLSIVGVDQRTLQKWKPAFLVMRILRVLRVVRVFKLARYNTLLLAFMLSMRRSTDQLYLTFALTFTGVIFFSTMVYFMEKDQIGTKFYSIPAGFWWCLVTMTTVGYGDMFPETYLGKVAGSLAIVCGRLVMALPMTIVVNNFTKVMRDMDSKRSMYWLETEGHLVE